MTFKNRRRLWRIAEFLADRFFFASMGLLIGTLTSTWSIVEALQAVPK